MPCWNFIGRRARAFLFGLLGAYVGLGAGPHNASRVLAGEPVTIEFRVHVPRDTPQSARIFLAGNHAALGRWQPDGVLLQAGPEGTHRAHVEFPRGTRVEFKVTRGTWETVEKGDRGQEIQNRIHRVEKPSVLDIHVASWASASRQVPHPTRPDAVRLHEKFASRTLDNTRTLAVYLPSDYGADSNRRYPVLYMHDGQNLFDPASSAFGTEWQADETADRLIRDGLIEPLIIVGIYNTPARMLEYSPPDASRQTETDRGDRYARFVVEEVKPFVDARYDTRLDRGHTAVAGSSLGGLISLYLCQRYPRAFSKCGMISPSVTWKKGRIHTLLNDDQKWLRDVSLWLQVGTREGPTAAAQQSSLAGARKIAAALHDAGLKRGRDFRYLEIPDGAHNETAWAAHFGHMLRWFFPRPASSAPDTPNGPPHPAAGKPTELTVGRRVPAWARDAVIYQIFPERFRNGDPSNDPTHASLEFPDVVPESWQISPWTGDWYARAPWERAMGENFYEDGVFHRRYGGDLQGIIDKLGYLESLGINTIYLNPVFYARSLHKYDSNSLHHVDPHFGPDPRADLQQIAGETGDPKSWRWTHADKLFLELIRAAHARGIRIVLDGVFNHTGRDFFAFADLRRQQQQSEYRTWYQVVAFDDPSTAADEFAYEGWWGIDTLPVFADNNDGSDLHAGPKAYIFAATSRWMDPDNNGDPTDGIDGWRLDVPNEVPIGFWKDWNRHVRRINPDAYTVTEFWHESSRFVREGGFSASMDYHGFAFPVKGFFMDHAVPPSAFWDMLQHRAKQHPEAVRYAMQNLVDSHDTDRVASMIVNAGRHRPYLNARRFDYDVTGQVSPRHLPAYDVRKPDRTQRRIQRLIVLFQMTAMGAPMIYYGTEAGMWGGDDPDNRMPMLWPEETFEPQASHPLGLSRPADAMAFDAELAEYYRNAIRLRRDHPALRRGALRVVAINDEQNSFVFQRTLEGRVLIVAVNRSSSTQELKIPRAALPDGSVRNFVPLLLSFGPRDAARVISTGTGPVRLELPGLTGGVFAATAPQAE